MLVIEPFLAFVGQEKAVFDSAASLENPFVISIPVALADHIRGAKFEF
jgi:hypothetical protein